MFGLILPLLALSAINYPKFYVIYADTTFDSQSIPTFEQLYNDYLTHFHEGCQALTGEEKEFCLAYVDAFTGVKATNSKDINTALTKVPSNNEFLLIVGDTLTSTINFAYLPKQMLVFLYGNSALPNSQSSKNIVEDIAEKFKAASFDRSKNGAFRLAKAFKSGKKSTKATLPVFPIYGKIQSRVSFLTVIGAELKIASGVLNCHSLFLSEGSKFSSSSARCNTTFFIADESSQKMIMESKTNLVISEQYGIFFDEYDYTEEHFLISYESDRWEVYSNDGTSTTFKTTGLYVPYSNHKAFNLITEAYNFDIHLNYDSLVNPKQVNITVTETINMAQLPELVAEPTVHITSSGKWQNVKNLPIQVITTDYTLDVSSKFHFQYEEFGIFDYFNPSYPTLPYSPTPKPTATPSPIKYPTFYVIYADTTFDSTSIPLFEEAYTNYVGHFRDGCDALEGEDRDFCYAYVNAFLGVKATNSKDINTALSGVPSNNEFLLVVGDTLSTTINFAYLKKQMLVFLYGNSAVPDSGNAKKLVEDIASKFKTSKIGRGKNSALRLVKAFKSNKKSTKEGLPVFPIVGNIKSKVSFLTVIGAELKISSAALDCHTLFLSEGSQFATGSLNCGTTFFIADESSQNKIQGTSLVKSEQYGLFFDEYDYSDEHFLISYESNRWEIYSNDGSSTTYKTTGLSVPYSTHKAFNMITLAFNFDIHLNYNYLSNPKPVNITVTDTINMAQLPELLAEEKVKITSSGKWQTVTTKPIEIIHSDYPVEIDRYNQLTYKTYEIFDYFSPTSVPLPYQPTPVPTVTPYRPTPTALKYPTFYVIYADTTFDSTSIPLFEEAYTNYIGHYRNACDALTGEDRDFCYAYVNAFLGVKAVNSKDINTALSGVPSNNEFLLIVGDTLSTTINFAYLKKQMLVFLYGNSAVPDSENAKILVEDIASKFKTARIGRGKNSALRLVKAFKSGKKFTKDDTFPVFPVVGNIKSKVSFLTVIGAELKITNSALDCHTLFLSEGSHFATGSLNCGTTFFIADESSQPFIEDTSIVTSEQYGIFFDVYDYTEDSFQISYTKDSWAIYSKDSSSSTYDYTGLSVKYSSYKAFNLIVDAYNFNFNLDYNYLTIVKPVNITVTETINMAQLPELLEEQKVRISSSGNWQTVSTKPVQVITTDYKVEVDYYYQLKYKTYGVFDYFSPSSAPLPYQPTPPPSATPYKPTPYPIDYPEFYVIYADATFDQESITLFEQLYKEYLKNFKDACNVLEGDEKEFCLAYVNAFLGVKAVNSKDINSALSGVPMNNEFLLIVGDTFSTPINFAYLRKQMLVFLYGNSATPNAGNAKKLAEDIASKFKAASIGRSKNRALRFAKAFKSNKKLTKETLTTFPVIGSIKSRVSFLTVIGAELKITNAALDCHTLFLSEGSRFSSGSYRSNTVFFIADESSQVNVAGTSFVLCEQYGLFFDEYDYSSDYFQVSYKRDRWAINIKDYSTTTYEYTNVYVPYNDYKALNLITDAYNFDIHLDYDYLKDPRQVNITVTDTINMAQLPELLAEQEQKVRLTSSGNWHTVANKPIEVITADHPVEIDPYYQPQFATYGIFDYLNPSSVPLPSTPTSPPPHIPSYPPPPSPSQTNNPDDKNSGGGGSSFGPGKIAGTVVGGAAGIGAVATAAACLTKKKDDDDGGGRSSELFDNMNP